MSCNCSGQKRERKFVYPFRRKVFLSVSVSVFPLTFPPLPFFSFLFLFFFDSPISFIAPPKFLWGDGGSILLISAQRMSSPLRRQLPSPRLDIQYIYCIFSTICLTVCPSILLNFFWGYARIGWWLFLGFSSAAWGMGHGASERGQCLPVIAIKIIKKVLTVDCQKASLLLSYPEPQNFSVSPLSRPRGECLELETNN